jgi:hypothetical protein
MQPFAHFDTTKPDGCEVRFQRLIADDDTAGPMDYLFQDEDYREQDQERLDAWRAGEWRFIGIAARAVVTVIRDGIGTVLEFDSPGLWGVESDSGEEYLAEVFAEECEQLKACIAALANPVDK